MDDTRARDLRKNLTLTESVLWNRLRLRQIDGNRFRRQHTLGTYIVDFVCLEKKLIIEIDGGQHDEQREYDSRRDDWLMSRGFHVMRFWNNQVFEEVNAVIAVIQEKLENLPPTLTLPLKGGGNKA